MNELLVTLELTEETAQTCMKAVGLEVEKDVHERSSVELKYGSGLLVLIIKSKDLTSMRAALNTYLRWIIMCSNLIGTEKQ
jgi:tRNA threonylcarbamoyladenosine modification (KEOPS) complex  Pcc1 subunit